MPRDGMIECMACHDKVPGWYRIDLGPCQRCGSYYRIWRDERPPLPDQIEMSRIWEANARQGVFE